MLQRARQPPPLLAGGTRAGSRSPFGSGSGSGGGAGIGRRAPGLRPGGASPLRTVIPAKREREGGREKAGRRAGRSREERQVPGKVDSDWHRLQKKKKKVDRQREHKSAGGRGAAAALPLPLPLRSLARPAAAAAAAERRDPRDPPRHRRPSGGRPSPRGAELARARRFFGSEEEPRQPSRFCPKADKRIALR